MDHIKAKRFGGTDALDNLQPLCRACHSQKTAKEGRGDQISANDLSPDLDELWSRFDITRIDVGPFDATASESFVEQLLQGPCSAKAVEALGTVSLGNPQLLRELVLDAIERGSLVRPSSGAAWSAKVTAGP